MTSVVLVLVFVLGLGLGSGADMVSLVLRYDIGLGLVVGGWSLSYLFAVMYDTIEARRRLELEWKEALVLARHYLTVTLTDSSHDR